MKGLKALLATGILLTMVSGCAQNLPVAVTAPRKAPEITPPAVTMQEESMLSMHKKIMKDLGISEAQLAQMKAVKKQHREKFLPNAPEVKKELKDLVLAPIIDATALTKFLDQLHEGMEAKLTLVGDLAGEMRAVLTQEQRDKLIGILSDKNLPAKMAKMHLKMLDRLVEGITLTTAQQNAFDALKVKAQAIHSEARMEAWIAAKADFLKTGDKAALVAKIETLKQEPPIDEVVLFLQSLDQTQRSTLVEKVEKWIAKMQSKSL
ncbi:MAG TPA: Spy/CpxP family protein refolding chaperone [Chroococcales cyanobacterium]